MSAVLIYMGGNVIQVLFRCVGGLHQGSDWFKTNKIPYPMILEARDRGEMRVIRRVPCRDGSGWALLSARDSLICRVSWKRFSEMGSAERTEPILGYQGKRGSL